MALTKLNDYLVSILFKQKISYVVKSPFGIVDTLFQILV
jgi:hypothetical protein